MSFLKNFKWPLTLAGLGVVLLVLLTWLGTHSNKATYTKPIEPPKEASNEKADIFSLLKRFSGTGSELNDLIDKLEKDTSNSELIAKLSEYAKRNTIEIYTAYSLYLQGINESKINILQESANMFFEAGTHDPDSMADRTTYSVYSKRACDLILKQDPKNLAALTRKAACEVYFDGAVMQGVSTLKEVESIDSNYVDAQHYLMLLALQSGQYEKAKKRLKKLLLLQPDNQQYADILKRLETQPLK